MEKILSGYDIYKSRDKIAEKDTDNIRPSCETILTAFSIVGYTIIYIGMNQRSKRP